MALLDSHILRFLTLVGTSPPLQQEAALQGRGKLHRSCKVWGSSKAHVETRALISTMTFGYVFPDWQGVGAGSNFGWVSW